MQNVKDTDGDGIPNITRLIRTVWKVAVNTGIIPPIPANNKPKIIVFFIPILWQSN